LEDETHEWAVDRIVGHHGRRSSALFEVLWKSGDKSWMSYDQAKRLQALEDYLEAVGAQDIRSLPYGSGTPPADGEELLVASAMFHFWAYKAAEPLDEFVPIPSSFPSTMAPPTTVFDLAHAFPALSDASTPDFLDRQTLCRNFSRLTPSQS
ncbi:hypothetical protein C8R44DRAFT_625837, partial [Mycena epipterygia]